MPARSFVPFVRGCAASAMLVAAGALPVSAVQGPGYVEKHRMLPTLPHTVGDFEPIDADGDGDLDLIANGRAGTSFLCRNDGSGLFELDPAALPVGPSSIAASAVGDVDGDGDSDLVLGIEGASTPLATLYLNDGSGTFSNADPQLPAGAGNTVDVKLADFDLDGDLDLVLALYPRLLLYLNDGAGNFAELGNGFPDFGTQVGSIAVGDVDHDDDLDVLVPEWGAGTTGLRLYANDGSGHFAATPILVPPDSGIDVELVDFDNDLDLDALFLGSDATLVLLNDGSGSFHNHGGISHWPEHVFELAAGDVDGDSRPDILIAVQGPNRLYLNYDGTGNLDDGSHLLPDESRVSLGVAPLDVDGDQDQDLLVANAGRPCGQLYLNDGAADFRELTLLDPIEEPMIAVVAAGDLDGDGDQDAVIGNRLWYPNRIYRNDGTGRLEGMPYAILPGPPTATTSLALGDVDTDGDLDLLIGNDASTEWTPGNERLFLNLGDGSFVDESARLGPPVSDKTTEVLFVDVERDGDLDVVVLNIGWGPCRLLRNSGNATFEEVPGAVPSVLDVASGAAGDVDDDGDLDLLVGFAHGEDQLWRNDGSGMFQPDPSALPPLTFWTSSIALGDVEGDGDLDAVLGARTASLPYAARNRLLINDGGGIFAESPDGLPDFVDATFDVVLRDLDEDGDLDLLTANVIYEIGGTHNELRLLNDGSGHFTPDDSFSNWQAASGSFAVADFDGDADQDVLRVRSDPHHSVLFSDARHLAWRGLPRVGKPLELVLSGPPGGRYLLLGARAAGSSPHPCGTWSIDRDSVFFREAGTFDALGRAEVSLLVPDDPDLVGTEIHWQAVVGPPCGFTGAERTLLTAY